MKKVSRNMITVFGADSDSFVVQLGITYAVVRRFDGQILAIGKELKGYVGDIIYTQYDDIDGRKDDMDYILKSDRHGVICKFKSGEGYPLPSISHFLDLASAIEELNGGKTGMYNTGTEFFKDMVASFGVNKALELSKEYLAIQENDDRKTGRFQRDPEEFMFCKQLWEAVQPFGKQ